MLFKCQKSRRLPGLAVKSIELSAVFSAGMQLALGLSGCLCTSGIESMAPEFLTWAKKE
jgi:hypothetical protein